MFFFFNDTATTEIYTLSLHDALPIFEFDVITDTGGDVEASYRVRIAECLQSIRLIKQCLERMPEGAVMGELGRRLRPKEGDGFGRVESPRGEIGRASCRERV